MKKFLLLPLVILIAAIVFLFTGCPNPDEPTSVAAPTITDHHAVTEGADFQLSWTDNAEGGAEVFFIYAEGSTNIDSTYNLSYTINSSDRASSVAVTAWIGNDESSKATHDLSLTVTTSLEVWSTADPDTGHPSFVKFSNGIGTAVSANSANEATFYIDDDIALESIHYWTGVTSTVDPAFATANSPYDFAPGTGNYDRPWPQGSSVSIGTTYYIWIDYPTYGTMGVEDGFAKIYVVDITGNKVTLNISYQTEAGLRWLVD